MSKSTSKKKTQNYLESLTKEELIDLILKFAPQNFFDSIDSQFASQGEAMILFKETSEAINTIFSDESLLYDPSEFERKLLKQLEKIRGLWDKLPSQIGDLIIKIIEDVEQAFEDGYLYIENYDKEDEYFESEDVNDYIFHFTGNLPKDMKSNYAKKLKKALNNSGYSTFSSIEKKLS
jgi:transcription elongation factor GreA-like protein